MTIFSTFEPEMVSTVFVPWPSSYEVTTSVPAAFWAAEIPVNVYSPSALVNAKVSVASQTESPSKSKNTLALCKVPCEATPDKLLSIDPITPPPLLPPAAASAKIPSPTADISKSSSILE